METKEPINTNQPLISIITPLYNAETYITCALNSVLNQTFTNWEHIIVDDCSTDDSVKILAELTNQDARIKLHFLPKNEGAAYCRNFATKLAKGDYIAFLDSDDYWPNNKLEKQLGFMQTQNCEVSYTSYIHVDETNNPLGKRILALPRLTYNKQLRNNYIGNLTGMYNVTTLGKIYAPKIRKRQDWALWLEAIKRSKKPAMGLQEDLAFYRVRANSISANKIDLIKYNYRIYRIHLGFSFFKSIGYLLFFFWEYFVIRPKQIEKY